MGTTSLTLLVTLQEACILRKHPLSTKYLGTYYSHDYHFSQWAHFTFGAGLIFNQTSQDFSGVEVVDLGDPSLTMETL